MLIQYCNKNELKCKLLQIKTGKDFEFTHSIKINDNSYTYPIILEKSLEIIGLQIKNETKNQNNIGLFIGILIKELQNLFTITKEGINKINKINFDNKSNNITNENNLNKIKIIYNTTDEDKIRIFVYIFAENNINNCFSTINGNKRKLCTHIYTKEIKLIIFPIYMRLCLLHGIILFD